DAGAARAAGHATGGHGTGASGARGDRGHGAGANPGAGADPARRDRAGREGSRLASLRRRTFGGAQSAQVTPLGLSRSSKPAPKAFPLWPGCGNCDMFAPVESTRFSTFIPTLEVLPMQMKYKLTVAAAIAAIAGIASAQEVVKIGHVAPMSGPQAHYGKDNENGVRMAIENLNAKGVTIAGKKLKLEITAEDHAAD